MKPLLIFLLVFSFSGSAQQNVSDLIKSGELKNKSADYQGALEDFNKAVILNEADLNTYLKKIEEYAKMSTYDKALNDNPDSPEKRNLFLMPYYGRGVAYAGLEQKNEALQDLEKALSIDKKHGPSYYERGLLKISAGADQEGCEDLKKASELGYSRAKNGFDINNCETFSSNYIEKGKNHLNNKAYNEAIKEFDLSIKFNPDSVAHFNRGLSYFYLKQYDKAIKDFTAALEFSEDSLKNPVYHYYRGLANYEQKAYQDAYNDFTVVLNKDNNHYDAHLYRANCSVKMDQPANAMYDYNNLIRMKPQDSNLYFQVALIKKEMNLRTEACEYFRKAMAKGHEKAEDYVKVCKDEETKGMEY